METLKDLKLKAYAIRNSNGLFFRSKGYGGYGNSWVKELKDAKIYLKIGSARGVVTFYNNLDDDNYGPPELIELTLSNAIILDEKNRLEKIKLKKQKDVLSREINNVERRLNKAKDDLNKLSGKKEEIVKLKEKLNKLNGD